MSKRIASAGILAAGLMVSGFALAGTPVFMSPAWAQELCTAWNSSPTLADKLGGSWVKNNGGKGYKVMEISDSSLKGSPPVQLEIAPKNGKAECIYGGPAKIAALNYSHDYKMWATTHNWHHMGSPMMAMMFGRLNFKGPKFEAMENMTPFSAFLKLVKDIPATLPAAS